LKDIEKREVENQGEKPENKTSEKIPEGENQRSDEKDKESVEGNQKEEADKTGEKPEEEAKDEKEKVTPETQITEPKDSPEDAPTEEPDDQQQTQIEEPSDNQSNKSQEKSTRGKSFETILIPEPDGKKTKGKKKYDDMNGSIREPGPPGFIDNSFGDLASEDYDGNAQPNPDKETSIKPIYDTPDGTDKDYNGLSDNFGAQRSKDYNGIYQLKTDKGKDFRGIDNHANDADKDYIGLGEDSKEKGNDSPQERGDRDFDNIDDESHEGRAESGGES